MDDNRDTLLSGVPRGELSRLESVVSGTSSRASPNASRRASEMVPVLLKKPPKERLREWGSVYLGNSQQADVFVHAVPILRRGSEERDATAALSRRGSIVSTRSDIGDGSLRGIHEVETDPDHVIFRARVFPILKDRNPFTMQRKFAKIELRNMALSALKGDAAKSSAASENVETPKPEEKEGENEEEKDKEGDSKMLDVDDGVSPKGRSKSTPTPKPSALHSPSPSSPAPRRLPHFDSRRTVMPIRKPSLTPPHLLFSWAWY